MREVVIKGLEQYLLHRSFSIISPWLHFLKLIVNKGQMLLNMHARLEWVGIILFSSLDGNYKSEIKMYTKELVILLRRQNKCPLHWKLEKTMHSSWDIQFQLWCCLCSPNYSSVAVFFFFNVAVLYSTKQLHHNKGMSMYFFFLLLLSMYFYKWEKSLEKSKLKIFKV